LDNWSVSAQMNTSAYSAGGPNYSTIIYVLPPPNKYVMTAFE